MARLPAPALERLGPLLDELRGLPALHERSPGTFTHRGGAFLHFHALASGLAADLKADGRWRRYEIERATGRRTLLRDVRRVLRGDTSQLAGHVT